MSELLKRLQTGQRHIEEYTRPNADFICPVCNQKSPCYGVVPCKCSRKIPKNLLN